MYELFIAAVLVIFGALPIITGVSAPTWVSSIAVIAFSAPLLIALYRHRGIRGIGVFVLVGLFAIIIETIGLETGFPYGSFSYDNHFGLSLPGGAPLLLPFAYVPLVFGAAALVRGPVLRRIALGALLLVAIDVVLDPGAVAFGLWSYEAPGIIGGVPLSNFIGWLFSGAIAIAITMLARPDSPALSFSLLLHLSFWTGVTLASGIYVSGILGIALIAFIASKRPLAAIR